MLKLRPVITYLIGGLLFIIGGVRFAAKSYLTGLIILGLSGGLALLYGFFCPVYP